MKRLILLLLALYSINCDILECSEERNIANCSSHDVKYIGDFNCHPFHYILGNDSLDICSIFPNSAEDQKIFWKITAGFEKESLSVLAHYNSELNEESDIIAIPEKEYYGTNEIVNMKYTSSSSDDMRIINSKNTCLYKFAVNSLLVEDYKFVNITDRNECFNTNHFPDLENLINCGYATITLNTDSGKPFTLQTCYYIPDNHLPDNFQKIFKALYMDMQLEGVFSSR